VPVAHVVLFHHAQGLRPDVLSWASSLREAGHEVETPDLFEGRTFERLDEGIAHRDEVGMPTLIGRAGKSLEGLPSELVYSGFSMGAAAAHYFAASQPGPRGAILMHGWSPPEFLEARWPAGAPGQVHYAAGDPQIDSPIEALEESARDAGGSLEVFTYPGSGHLFADPDGPDYDADSARLMLERELELLARL
jgi:dienelactone hydrolase